MFIHVLTCFFLCSFNFLVYFNDVCVGGVCCRKETVAGSATQNLYIATLGVLAPYRRLGLGKEVKNFVLNAGLSHNRNKKKYKEDAQLALLTFFLFLITMFPSRIKAIEPYLGDGDRGINDTQS